MTDKQKRFCEEYMIDLNATQAAIRAGYSPKTANEQAGRLLVNVSIQNYIAQLQARQSRRTGVSADRVVRELAKIAFVNAGDLIDPETASVKLDASRDDLAAVQSVKVKTFGEDGLEHEVKLADKLKALDLLGRHLGLFSGTAEVPLAEPESSGPSGDAIFQLLAPQFLPTWQKILRGEADEALEKGGRGSTKSSFCSIGILKLLQLHPDCNAACLRRVGNTLRTSVYAQMQWAADQLEPGAWKCTVSPMEMTNKNTGQKILFFGLDDPGKLKSIKLPHGYIGILWFEELDQYDGPEQIRNVEQSCLRGGDFSFTFKSFNPPASPRNWANRYALEVRDRKIIQHSDYTMVPPEWLGPRFLDDAEELKKRNLIAYKHEYLGEVTGCGKEVFTNIRAEKIDPAKFERKYHGIDWGWYPDPFAYNCMSYDAARKTLYIYDEITVRRTRNEDTFKMLQDRHVMEHPESERLTADSAENKSCTDYTAWGMKCLPAIKGPNSVGQGVKWLQSLTAIVIDPVRCPDTLKEFTEYEYDADKNGEPLPGYPDHDNHHIDATRYAMELVWHKPGK